MQREPIERVLILGAGIAGLFAAMMLARPGRDIILMDRDPEPPLAAEDDADAVFHDWRRRGVGHLRHSHAFLARLLNSLRARHPRLIEQLQAAGCREMTLADMLPSTLKDRYRPEPGDAQLSILMSRRTTFECVARRYVASLPGVTIIPDVFVTGLLTRNAGVLVVEGVRTERGEDVRADLVVDATGRLSQTGDWLATNGVTLPELGAPAGIVYFTRHWRLKPDQPPPPRNGAPGAGDLGYLKYGLFNADNGWFSVTLAVPEVESELRQAIVQTQTFDAICNALPGVAPWIAPELSTPETKVFAMGDLASHWRRMVADGRPLTLGLFLIGDGLIRSNPLYGRGTSFAMIEAEALSRALDASADPDARARLYDSLVEQALKPFYDDMLQQDQTAIRRAENLHEGRPDTFRGQVMRSFVRDGAVIAVRDDLPAFRAALRAFHMLDPPRAWLTEPRHVGLMLKTWARGRRRNAHLYPTRLGPERQQMLALLGLESAATLAA